MLPRLAPRMLALALAPLLNVPLLAAEPGVSEPSRTPSVPVSPAEPSPPATPSTAPTLPPSAQQPTPAGPLPTTDPDLSTPPEMGVSRATLYLLDGRQFTGIIIEAPADPAQPGARYILRISGIDTTFPAKDVERARYLEPASVQYQRLRSQIQPGDTESLFKLAEWLIAKGEFDLARKELDVLPAPDAATARAKALRADLDRQAALRAGSAPDTEPHPSPLPPDDAEPAPKSAAARVPVLSPEQVNLIKVYELNLALAPSVLISRDTMKRVLDANAGHPLVPASPEARELILRSSPLAQLELIFKLRARDFYREVKVQSPVETIRRFSDDVLRSLVLSGCATSQCHGGEEAGRLIFATRRPNSDPTVYTNLLIVDRFRTATGQPLINWDKPESSILLQMALPRDVAVVDHPVVPMGEAGADAWRPLLRSPADQRFKDVAAWIRSMYHPHPEYPVEYTPLRPFTTQTPER